MKKRPMTRGFTLIELLVVIAIIAMLAAGAFTGFGAVMPGVRAKQAAKQLTTINTWLNAFALEGTNNGQFPQGSTANQAFRQLFMGGYGADEMQFYIPNDAYHNTRPNKRPDNDKGQAPDYVQALQPGLQGIDSCLMVANLLAGCHTDSCNAGTCSQHAN